MKIAFLNLLFLFFDSCELSILFSLILILNFCSIKFPFENLDNNDTGYTTL